MSSEPRYYTPLLWLLLGVCVVCFWVTLLPESFWLDETVTAFVLRHGSGHPSLAAGPRLDQTIYYWLPRASSAVFGFSEWSVRLPSLLVTLVSLLLIYRFAVALIHPQAGWLAVFLCFVPHEFTRQATDARPYGLGTCAALCAMWFLIRWLDRGGWRDAVLFVVLAALLLRVHLVYWPFLAVYGAYSLVRFFRCETPVSGRVLAVMWTATLVLLAPLVPVTLELFRNQGAHVVTAFPRPGTILTGFGITAIGAVGLAAWLIARVFRWPRERWAMPVSTLVLLLMWWLWQPAVLLAASWITGNPVFVPRYFSLAIPGLMLACVAAVGFFIPARLWRPAALLLGAGIIVVHFVKEPFPPTRYSHWREAAAQVDELTRGTVTPVICTSPFVEARFPVWSPEYALPGFLFSHLDAYPIRERPILLPAAVEVAGQQYTRTLMPGIVPAGRFVIYGGGYGVNHWAPWFTEQPELVDWEHRLIGTFGDVEVVLYQVRKR